MNRTTGKAASSAMASTASCSHSGDTSCTQPSSEQIEHFLYQAEQICTQRHQRFTALRRQVLELVCRCSQPVGAYSLLDEMKKQGRSAAPPTVYRALDFLQQQGLVHRLATNNTYLACAHPHIRHQGLFLVCSACGHTQEVHTEGIVDAVREYAADFDFLVEHAAVEVTGLCRACQSGLKDQGGSNE